LWTATKKPQIVAAVHKNELYVAWQTWGERRPAARIVVGQTGLDRLTGGKLAEVRTVASHGALVGFTVDETGADHVLSAAAEELPNDPPPNFVSEIHNKWRKGVITLSSAGRAVDLNSPKYTGAPFYGLTSGGSGRLAAGRGLLAAVFARRHYSPRDKLIHQEANALLVQGNPATVLIKAGNTVSHSFDQRLLFDGTEFVALHQADTYPFTGLIVEKLRTHPAARVRLARYNAYACPTFGNAVYFELGGLAAEADGYPVLFTATRNTHAVTAENARAMHGRAWDLAMVYVARDFDARPNPPSPYNITGSGVLVKGYAPDEEFKVNNFTWNPQTSRYDKAEPRTIKRRVLWLTENDQMTKATRAKLVKLRPGQYVAVWEEHTLTGRGWRYATTRALALTAQGKGVGKARSVSITRGRQVELKGLRLHQGDDAVALTVDGAPHAGWVTAGATRQQLVLHTLDGELRHKTYPLTLP
jgi:hypothetical protein